MLRESTERDDLVVYSCLNGRKQHLINSPSTPSEFRDIFDYENARKLDLAISLLVTNSSNADLTSSVAFRARSSAGPTSSGSSTR